MNKYIKRKQDLYMVPCESCIFRSFKKGTNSKSIKPFWGYCNCPKFNRKEFLSSDMCAYYCSNLGEFFLK